MADKADSGSRRKALVHIRLLPISPIAYCLHKNPLTFLSIGAAGHANSFHFTTDGVGVGFEETHFEIGIIYKFFTRE